MTKCTNHRHQTATALATLRKARSSASLWASAPPHPPPACSPSKSKFTPTPRTKARARALTATAGSGARTAVPRFDGDALGLAAFFDAFEAEAGTGTLSDASRIAALVRHASRPVAAFWRTLDGYGGGGTYAAFKAEICWVYHGQRVPRRFRVRDLERAVREGREGREGEERWRARFEEVAGWLVGNGDITEGERREYWEEGVRGVIMGRREREREGGGGMAELVERTAGMGIRV